MSDGMSDIERGPHWRSWDSDTITRQIDANEREACRLMAQADGMRRVLIKRGELPDPGEGDCRTVAQ
jgi:hypothetical protein